MITLAETYQRERQAGEREGRRLGEQEGRQQALSETLSEYVRLFWDEATSQAFRQRLPAADSAVWPSLSDLHATYQARRDPLQLLVSRDGLTPKPKEDAAPATTEAVDADAGLRRVHRSQRPVAVSGTGLRRETPFLDALRREMVKLAEIYQRERQAGEQEGRRLGEQEGRQQALSETLSEYVRLFWDEATSQAFRQRLPAADSAVWPSLSDLHAAYQARRDPLQLLVSRDGLAPKPKEDAAPATT